MNPTQLTVAWLSLDQLTPDFVCLSSPLICWGWWDERNPGVIPQFLFCCGQCTLKAQRGKKMEVGRDQRSDLDNQNFTASLPILNWLASVYLACKHVHMILLTYNQQRLEDTLLCKEANIYGELFLWDVQLVCALDFWIYFSWHSRQLFKLTSVW